jgi:hypothetical protein
MEGPWKEWSQAQPEGTNVEITEQMIAESGDDNVVELHRLALAIWDSIRKLRP